MSPARRRAAVAMLCDRLHVSERWACQVCGQHRSTQRREPTPAGDDEALRSELRAFSQKRPRWGYRQAHTHLQQEGWEINRKRVQRVWREEGLRVPQRTRKRRRLGDATAPKELLRAERPGHVWAFDFQFDQTADGRAIKLLNVVDEFTREALVMHTAALDPPADPSAHPAHHEEMYTERELRRDWTEPVQGDDGGTRR